MSRVEPGARGRLPFRWPSTVGERRTMVMGVLNVTPDSFSDGGRHYSLDDACRGAVAMADAGAVIIDVGGESTRPGAAAVSLAQELERVVPVVERLRREIDVAISIDTSKPEVMRAAVDAGADIVNDVRALRLPGALETVAALGVPVCLMHMQGEPRTMQQAPRYRSVVDEVNRFFDERIAACIAAGIAPGDIAVDPGFGFGKTLEHNLMLLNRLGELLRPEHALLVGLSRKSMLARITGRGVDERLLGSVALALIAVLKGAHVVRVHDVAETIEAVTIADAVYNERVTQDG